MDVVVDSNILFSYFWKNSITKKIIDLDIFNLYSPDFALTEINKYKSDIIKKTKISSSEFNLVLDELKSKIKFVSVLKYSSEFKKIDLNKKPDVNDVDFFACSLYLNAVIWSNDVILKNQSLCVVFNTKDILEIIKKISYVF
ncbi:MAG: PIN domain-containing protein [Candidatus ainarchaeum sp.]|nr:PIN domain-containing protein [Candidatus ainarchaeum sp.]